MFRLLVFISFSISLRHRAKLKKRKMTMQEKNKFGFFNASSPFITLFFSFSFFFFLKEVKQFQEMSTLFQQLDFQERKDICKERPYGEEIHENQIIVLDSSSKNQAKQAQPSAFDSENLSSKMSMPSMQWNSELNDNLNDEIYKCIAFLQSELQVNIENTFW